MSTALAEVRTLALKLDETERLELAHELFETVDPETLIDWQELGRRIKEVKEGTAELITMDELERSMEEAIHGSNSAHP